MKLYATIKNERGGKKSTGDNTRILVELSYGNKLLGTVGLYAITGTDLRGQEVSGYRVLWGNKIIEELEIKGKKKKGERCYAQITDNDWCNNESEIGSDYCPGHQYLSSMI